MDQMQKGNKQRKEWKGKARKGKKQVKVWEGHKDKGKERQGKESKERNGMERQ